MICPAKVSRPAMAVQSRGAVKVLVRPEAGWLAAMAIADRSSRSASTWKSSSALAFTHRKQCARWIAEAEREETRQRRVQPALAMIRAGKART